MGTAQVIRFPIERTRSGFVNAPVFGSLALDVCDDAPPQISHRTELHVFSNVSDENTTITSGDTSIDGVIGMLDPTLLANGLYRLRLSAKDQLGRTNSATTDIFIDGGMKVGNFRISFTDLQIPIFGIPITVTRTYDTLNKRRGEFGVGWTMDVSNVQLRKARPIGENWMGNVTTRGAFGFPITVYSIEEQGKHLVSITFPDGRVERFKAVVSPSSQDMYPIQATNLSFEPLRGTRGGSQTNSIRRESSG